MIIKDSFRLISNTPNILKIPESTLRTFHNEENSPRHVFAILELKKNSIVHFSTKTIFDLITNTKKREAIQIVTLDYPLHASYNPPTKGMIVNLKPFEVKEISNMSPNDLYAAIVYSYAFRQLVTKKFKISESYAQVIVRYLLSFYVQLFGKEYGLVGIYASGIPKLKFLIACYILSAFFGHAQNKKLFMKASTLAPYMYSNEFDQLKKYDFKKIEDFVKAVSDLKVMPGLSITKLTAKLYRFFGINLLAGIEDCSRFFSAILTSSVPGSRVVPRFLFKYNEKEYFKLVEITRRMFK